MNEYQIITDFGCDLPFHIVKELNIEVIPMEVFIEGEEPKPGSEIDVYEFYQKLREKKVAKTSAVSIDAFVTAFTAHLEKGEDIVYVALSSGLSGTFSAANIAAGELREKYPERKIYIVDSRSGSIGEGLIAYFAALKKSEGATAQEASAYALETAYQLCSWFTVDDLFFLKRGGRLSAATALVGSLFMIKPILHANEEGKLIPSGKARGRRGAIKVLADAVERLAVDPAEQIIGISHSDCLKDALDLETMLREKWDIKDVIISEIGPLMGAHCGPGTLAVFFIGTEK